MNKELIKIKETIIGSFPCIYPYKFIDDITFLNDEKIIGTYLYKEDEFFYSGHFKGNPITPGAILLETMAQIGLLAFGSFLVRNKVDKNFFLTSSDVKFLKVVKPKDLVIVMSKKIFFRHGKLKCSVVMKNQNKETISTGVLSGMLI